jgi:predicted nucleotidyltransferase
MILINNHREKLKKACQDHEVDELYAFGSILTDQFSDESDIDFIVSIFSEDPIEYAENYFELKFELEKIFNRKIDLLEQQAIKNETFKNLVDQQKKLVYARRNGRSCDLSPIRGL